MKEEQDVRMTACLNSLRNADHSEDPDWMDCRISDHYYKTGKARYVT